MVNFNNETTVTRPLKDISNMIVVQRRQDLIDKFISWQESLIYREGDDDQIKQASFRAFLLGFLFEIYPIINNEIPKEKTKLYKNTQELIDDAVSTNPEDNMRAFIYINQLVYSKGYTKTDTKDVEDPEDIFGENERDL